MFSGELGQLTERAVLLPRGELGLFIDMTGGKLLCFFQMLQAEPDTKQCVRDSLSLQTKIVKFVVINWVFLLVLLLNLAVKVGFTPTQASRLVLSAADSAGEYLF